jgi:hypothetical protein
MKEIDKLFIESTVKKILAENKLIKENSELVDTLLDKMNTGGRDSLSADERTYLRQYSSTNINKNLENWLLSTNTSTFNDRGDKLLYDEFEEGEDILYNEDKLVRVISKHLRKAPYSDNASWGGGKVWNIGNSNDNFVGTFLYLGDDELVMLKRKVVDGDGYEDTDVKDIRTSKELYNVLLASIKNKIV